MSLNQSWSSQRKVDKMTKLTEDMIIARTKTSELGTVKKLNCWGSDLDDVTLVKKLTNVEVLSLSLNKIKTLQDFQYCKNLVELYIRRNAITDLSELCYIQDLPRLRRLLISENPCVETAGPIYRATVIRCLPNLDMLDEKEVTPEEVEQSMRIGLILEHPLARLERISPELVYREDSPPMTIMPNSAAIPTGRRGSNEYTEVFTKSSLLSRSPPEYTPYLHQKDEPPERRSPVDDNSHPFPSVSVPPTVVSAAPTAHVQQAQFANVNSPSARHRERRTSRHSSDDNETRGPTPPTPTAPAPATSVPNNAANNNNITNLHQQQVHQEANIVAPSVRKVQRSPVQEYYPQSQMQQQQAQQPSPREREIIVERDRPGPEYTNGGGYLQRRGSQEYLLESTGSARGSYHQDNPYNYDDSPPPQVKNYNNQMQRHPVVPNNRVLATANKARSKVSSNLLSAVLCLIPELDWASLEVVELAIRRRMDELVSD